jgi:hypothetical protein
MQLRHAAAQIVNRSNFTMSENVVIDCLWLQDTATAQINSAKEPL